MPTIALPRLSTQCHRLFASVCCLMPTPGFECSSSVLAIVFQFGLKAQDWAACLHAWSPYELSGWLLGDCIFCDLLLQGRRGACSAPRPERVLDRPRVFAQHGAPGALCGRSPHHNCEGRPPFPTTQAFSHMAIQTPSEIAAMSLNFGPGKHPLAMLPRLAPSLWQGAVYSSPFVRAW